MEFVGFPKMARLNREIVITEKIDGTNAQIYITLPTADVDADKVVAEVKPYVILAGSRTKWITPGKQSDNAGFAAWVEANAEELFKLGPGQHFGEWWGGKIQRGYGLTEKRFSLFNTSRWIPRCDSHRAVDNTCVCPDCGYTVFELNERKLAEGQQEAPGCCHVVPVLYQGPFAEHEIKNALSLLREHGSQAAPGFMRPEGIVIYHTAANQCFKVTLEGDESHKSFAKVA